MRVLVQRVTSAAVSVDGEQVAAITPRGQGLLALVGVTHCDDAGVAARMAEKLWQLRILDGERSAAQTGAPILVVSQFTLYASTKKGNRPSFIRAARPEQAIPLYEKFVAMLSAETGIQVQTGEFGADMKVSLVNDGPVTIIMDSRDG